MIIVRKATKMWALLITFMVVGALLLSMLHLWHNVQKYSGSMKIFQTSGGNKLGSSTDLDGQKGNIAHMNLLGFHILHNIIFSY